MFSSITVLLSLRRACFIIDGQPVPSPHYGKNFFLIVSSLPTQSFAKDTFKRKTVTILSRGILGFFSTVVFNFNGFYWRTKIPFQFWSTNPWPSCMTYYDIILCYSFFASFCSLSALINTGTLKKHSETIFCIVSLHTSDVS